MTDNFDATDVPAVALILLHGMLSSGNVKAAALEDKRARQAVIGTAYQMAEQFIDAVTEGEAP
jgi:hypothetical protein